MHPVTKKQMPFLPLILIGGLLAAALYKQSTVLVNALNFTPKRFSLNKNSFGLFETKGQMILNLANNSNVTASIDSIVGNILSNGVTVGRYEILTPFKIPAKNNVDLNVQVIFYNSDFVSAIVSLISSGKTPTLSLNGDIRTNLGTQSFTNQVFKETKLF